MNNAFRFIGITVSILVVVAVGAGIFYAYTVFSQHSRPAADPKVQDLVMKRQNGDYANAVDSYKSLVSDSSKTNSDRALAIMGSAGAEFHLTGDVNTSLQDIKALKQVVLDTTLSARTRAEAVNDLASLYAESGRSPIVFQEIFKDAPFSQSLVKDSPQLSIRKLYEWSYYSISPTANAAVMLAKAYAVATSSSQQVSATDLATSNAAAEAWLKKADALVLSEQKSDPTYPESTMYANFLYYRTLAVTRLAKSVGEPYKSEYPNDWESYIAFAQKSQNAVAKENLLYARFYYSDALSKDGKNEAAKAQTDLLIKDLNSLEEPYKHAFPLMIVNAYHYQNSLAWMSAKNLARLSSDFKAELDKLVAGYPSGSSTSTSTQQILR